MPNLKRQEDEKAILQSIYDKTHERAKAFTREEAILSLGMLSSFIMKAHQRETAIRALIEPGERYLRNVDVLAILDGDKETNMSKADQFATLVRDLSNSTEQQSAQLAAKNLLLFIAQNAAYIEHAMRYNEDVDTSIGETLERMVAAMKSENNNE